MESQVKICAHSCISRSQPWSSGCLLPPCSTLLPINSHKTQAKHYGYLTQIFPACQKLRAVLRAEDSTDTQRNWLQWGRSSSLLFSRKPFDVFTHSEVWIIWIIFTKINTTKARSSCVLILHNEIQVYVQAEFDFHCTPHTNSTCTDHAGTDSPAASAIKYFLHDLHFMQSEIPRITEK